MGTTCSFSHGTRAWTPNRFVSIGIHLKSAQQALHHNKPWMHAPDEGVASHGFVLRGREVDTCFRRAFATATQNQRSLLGKVDTRWTKHVPHLYGMWGPRMSIECDRRVRPIRSETAAHCHECMMKVESHDAYSGQKHHETHG